MMVWLSAPAGFVGATAGVLLRRLLSEGKHARGESVAELAERLSGGRGLHDPTSFGTLELQRRG